MPLFGTGLFHSVWPLGDSIFHFILLSSIPWNSYPMQTPFTWRKTLDSCLSYYKQNCHECSSTDFCLKTYVFVSLQEMSKKNAVAGLHGNCRACFIRNRCANIFIVTLPLDITASDWGQLRVWLLAGIWYCHRALAVLGSTEWNSTVVSAGIFLTVVTDFFSHACLFVISFTEMLAQSFPPF